MIAVEVLGNCREMAIEVALNSFGDAFSSPSYEDKLGEVVVGVNDSGKTVLHLSIVEFIDKRL